MDSVALFVDFDDVYSSLRKKSLTVPPSLLAQSLRRTARAFGSPLRAYACAGWSQYPQVLDAAGKPLPSAREAFEQEGFEVLSSASRQETVWRMEERIFRLVFDEPTPPKTFILATNDGQFAPAVDRLRSLSYQTRLWAVGDDSSPFDSSGLVITPLEELLDLQTKTLALFIDLENIIISLNNLDFLVDPVVLARRFREHAQRQGTLVEAYAYADWQKLPPAFDTTGRNLMAEAQRTFELNAIQTRYLITVAGKNTADMRIADDIRDLLEDRNHPDVFIIASGDRDFTPIIDTLVRSHKEVAVWGVEGCTSLSLSRLARVEHIQSFIPLLKRGQALPAVGDPFSTDGTKGSELDEYEEDKQNGPTTWTKLVMVLDNLMKRNNWKWVSLSRATAEMMKLKEFGPTEEDSRGTLNQAVAKGIILKERIQNPNPGYPDQFVWVFRPNEDSPVVRAARLIPERIIDIMRYGLGRMEYVAYSYLQTQLARDRSLVQPSLDLDEEGRTQWINLLIADGVIVASRRPHHRNPSDLVTALTLPDTTGATSRQIADSGGPHPVRDGRQGVSADTDGSHYRTNDMWKRLVVSIDHFTIRSGMDWAPLITLRQRLSTFGREDMEMVFRAAVEAGDVMIEEYPNPNKPYPTKGASLNYNSEAVQEVLADRDHIVSAVIGVFEMGRELTSQALREAASGEGLMTEEQCRLWLSMLVGDRILSCCPIIPGQAKTYQFNTEHPVVRRVAGSGEVHAAGEVPSAYESSGLLPGLS